VVTGRDVTEQNQMENTLRENELKFRSLFDHAPAAIGISDIDDGRLFEVNTSWVRFFGYSREELIGRSLGDLVMFSYLEGHGEIDDILREGCEIVNRHIPLRKKSGEVVNFPFSVEIITVDNRSSLKVIMIDITRPLRAENGPVPHRVTARNSEKIVDDSIPVLHHGSERLQNFMSIMYHECIASLAMIRANIGLIELKMKFGDCLNDIELNKINRAIEQIEDLLEIANQEGSSSESLKTDSFTVFRIAPVIAAPIESFRAMWPERSLIYLEEVEDVEISGLPFRIKVAIFNLLDNARKYSPPDSLIRMQSCREGLEVVIRLRYLGTGITQDEAEITFEKSARGSNFYYKTGSRLGLWLVKDIVENHNGSVTLESIESGVEITVRLPLSDRSD